MNKMEDDLLKARIDVPLGIPVEPVKMAYTGPLLDEQGKVHSHSMHLHLGNEAICDYWKGKGKGKCIPIRTHASNNEH